MLHRKNVLSFVWNVDGFFFIINQAFVPEKQLLMVFSLLRVAKIGLYYIL